MIKKDFAGINIMSKETFDNMTLSEFDEERIYAIPQENIITDAPKDGNAYVRKDGEWVNINDL